jgi:uncharacterized protein with von Willebrand factor type A (vWA) domain
MGRPKNYENMTHEERMEFHAKQREQEAMVREALLFQLKDKYPSMVEAVDELSKIADRIGDCLQWEGPQYVSVDEMHKLIDTKNTVRNLFHLDVEEQG